MLLNNILIKTFIFYFNKILVAITTLSNRVKQKLIYIIFK